MPVGSVGSRKALREELDVHSSIIWEKLLREGVDGHFNCWYKDLAGAFHLGEASDYWSQEEFDPFGGEFKCPADKNVVSLRSKNAFPYGLLTVNAKYPKFTKNGQAAWLGFEAGDLIGASVASFGFWRLAGVDSLYVYAGGCRQWVNVDITNLLPGDYATAYHGYAVTMRRNLVEFSIDRNLVAVAVNGRQTFTAIPGPPYAIIGMPARFNPVLPVYMDLEGLGSLVTWDASPYNFRVVSGDPISPAIYSVYDAGTTNLFAGLTIAAGSETSHPVPVLGYPSKTFHFRANQSGDIDIEILMQTTNNWRIYKPDAGGHTESNYIANELWSFIMTGDVILARLTFDPDAYPCTISEAEVVLR